MGAQNTVTYANGLAAVHVFGKCFPALYGASIYTRSTSPRNSVGSDTKWCDSADMMIEANLVLDYSNR